MTLGILGLGRMGAQIARRLHTAKFNVIAWNRSEGPRKEFESFGGRTTDSVPELVERLPSPKIIWLMLPAGDLVDEFLFGGSTGSPTNLSLSSSKGDIVIVGGNSFYRDSQTRAKKLAEKGIHFFDSGTSGGVWGERNGFSLMVGGSKTVWPQVEPIFKALAYPSDSPPRPPATSRVASRAGEEGLGEVNPLSISPSRGGEVKGHYGLVGPNGAGHFVKMVHNGIEYGMMEAIAEGFGILSASEFKDLNFSQVAHIWSKGSVVSSWLVDLAKNIFDTEDLEKVSGFIAHTGEGQWTINEAKKLGVDVPVIENSFRVRVESEKPKNQEKFSNKIVALLRNQFGGHEVKHK